MNPIKPSSPLALTRRHFIKTSGKAAAGVALAGALARPGYASDHNTVKIALVGCGGRGTGAASQALSTQGPTRLWAMADVSVVEAPPTWYLYVPVVLKNY